MKDRPDWTHERTTSLWRCEACNLLATPAAASAYDWQLVDPIPRRGIVIARCFSCQAAPSDSPA